MKAESSDLAVAGIAAAIGEPARTRMLYCLLDGHARTSTELAIVAKVTPSTASVHLNRLKDQKLVTVQVQGRHRYYALRDAHVARALEGLSIVAGIPQDRFEPSTPSRYRLARSCYDHMAGKVAVTLLESFRSRRWLRAGMSEGRPELELTAEGAKNLHNLGLDTDSVRAQRRRFAYGCLDWSERRQHLAGALGSALLSLFIARRWIERDLDSRALFITTTGRRELNARFDVSI